ncbi:UNVERIFIED_CONTAM: hypothetical protein O8I53_09645 [Campylobacter lari]
MDKNGNRVNFGTADNVVTSILSSANAESLLDKTGDTEKIKSVGYEAIKKAIKELLDQFYQEYNLNSEEKIE